MRTNVSLLKVIDVKTALQNFIRLLICQTFIRSFYKTEFSEKQHFENRQIFSSLSIVRKKTVKNVTTG